MSAVDVGVGHDDDAVIAQLRHVEVLAGAGAQRLEDGGDLGVAEDLVRPAPSRRSGSCPAAAGSPGSDGRGPAWPSRPPSRPRRGRARSCDGSRSEQSASLPGSVVPSSSPLRMTRSRALRAASRAAGGGDALLDDPAALLRGAPRGTGRGRRRRRLDLALHLGVAQAGLRLPLELRLRQAHADDGDEPLAHVVAGEVGVVVLEDLLLAGVVVEDAGEGAAEAGQVAAAVDGVDAVGEAEGRLGEAVVVLEGRLDRRAVAAASRCRSAAAGGPRARG